MIDFSAAAMMQAQIATMQQAVDILNNGGRIPNMRVATAMDVTPGADVLADTANVVLTPEMLAAIADAMQAQLDEMMQRLVEVTQRKD
jgi:hypothetical protein